MFIAILLFFFFLCGANASRQSCSEALKPGKLVSTIDGGKDDDHPLYVDYPDTEEPAAKRRRTDNQPHATLADLDAIAEGRLRRKFTQHVVFNPTDCKSERPSTVKVRSLRTQFGGKCAMGLVGLAQPNAMYSVCMCLKRAVTANLNRPMF